MRIFFKIMGIILIFAACNNKPVHENTSVPAAERAAALVKELTADEKIALMLDVSEPIERLGIKEYNWWNEALHGVGRAGRATVFPQPIGMAATFDDSLIFNVFTAVSDEASCEAAVSSPEEASEAASCVSAAAGADEAVSPPVCPHAPRDRTMAAVRINDTSFFFITTPFPPLFRGCGRC